MYGPPENKAGYCINFLFELRVAMSSSAALTTSSALTPIGTCVGWRPDFPWLPVAADGLTALAYWSVPIALALALRRRRRRALVPWSAAAIPVAAFAAAAGAAHAASAVAFWRP